MFIISYYRGREYQYKQGDCKEACSECEVIERRCSGDTCCDAAANYGIKAVPTVVVDGVVAVVGKPDPEQVRQIFV